jgi:hypothetical protein
MVGQYEELLTYAADNAHRQLTTIEQPVRERAGETVSSGPIYKGSRVFP